MRKSEGKRNMKLHLGFWPPQEIYLFVSCVIFYFNF